MTESSSFCEDTSEALEGFRVDRHWCMLEMPLVTSASDEHEFFDGTTAFVAQSYSVYSEHETPHSFDSEKAIFRADRPAQNPVGDSSLEGSTYPEAISEAELTSSLYLKATQYLHDRGQIRIESPEVTKTNCVFSN